MSTLQLIQRFVLLVIITSACALPALAQQTGDDVIRVNTELVQTDFTVFDKQAISLTASSANNSSLK